MSEVGQSDSPQPAQVTLREITMKNFRECIDLEVNAEQKNFVATNVISLAQAKVNPYLTPLAIYDGKMRGRDPGPDDPMVGFTMYQVRDGVGFVVRLMIAIDHQGKGYGKATMREVIRRLKMNPEVEMIGTSFIKENTGAAALYYGLGFEDYPAEDSTETVVVLPWNPQD